MNFSYHDPKGGALPVRDIKAIVDASYDAPETLLGRYKRDDAISKHKNGKLKKTLVYFNPDDATDNLITFQGTTGPIYGKDWVVNNGLYGISGDVGYKRTDRYDEGVKAYDEAKKKYGAHNIRAVGHSQAGHIAQEVAKDAKEIFTYNKADNPLSSNKQGPNQYDIRSEHDPVSALNPLRVQNDRVIIIPKPKYTQKLLHRNRIINKFKNYAEYYGGEHSSAPLERLDQSMMIGNQLT